MKSDLCPIRWKRRHFNEAWAIIAADQILAEQGVVCDPYRCRCGWWHVRNVTKRRLKWKARRADRQRQRRRQDRIPLHEWENEGGACST